MYHNAFEMVLACPEIQDSVDFQMFTFKVFLYLFLVCGKSILEILIVPIAFSEMREFKSFDFFYDCFRFKRTYLPASK